MSRQQDDRIGAPLMLAGVLRVSKLGAGRALYYLEPPMLGVEAPGSWVEEGAGSLGLRGTVDAADLGALLEASDPHSGEPLPPTPRRIKVHGYDLTFAAPKSISLLHALGEPEVSAAVLGGHERAVASALGYLDVHALAVRRRVGDIPRVPVPAQVPMAMFVHRTSRALDPHLHTHAVVPNTGLGPDGRWSALDGRGIYAHRAAADALYHCQLRHELTSTLGVAFEEPTRGRSDVVGIGVDARRAFSRRSQEIAEALGAGGPQSHRAADIASHRTRAERDLSVSAEDLLPQWRFRAKEVGLGPRRLEALLDRVSTRAVETDVARPDEVAVADALATLRDPQRPFARRDVVRAWAASRVTGAPSASVTEVVDSFLDRSSLLDADDGARLDAPGVGERRHLLPERLRSRDIDVLLERRQMQSADELTRIRHRSRSLGFDRDRDRDLGMGFGLDVG